MTLKMLIVDDEPLICQGLSNTIPWEEIDIDIVGSANNGKKALEIIQQEPVDIVITDVYMPEMDGIHLSKALAEGFPEVTIIMISGYEEFEYARQAIRIGVEDYLLKPVDIDELFALIKDVKQQIEKTRKEEQDQQETMLTNYLSQQVFDLPDSYNLEEKIKMQAYSFRLLMIERKNYMAVCSKDTEMELANHLKEVIAPCELSSICIETHENQLVVFLYDQQDVSNDNINQFITVITEAFDNQVSLAISSSYHDLHHVSLLYQELNQRLSFYRGSAKQVITDKENMPSEKHFDVDKQIVDSISNAVFQQDKLEVDKVVNQLFIDLEQNQLTLVQIKGVAIFLLNSIKERGQASTFENLEFTLGQELDLLIYNSIDALQAVLSDDLELMINFLQHSSENHWIIQHAKQYIEKNYQKDIKAVEVAEEHYITPNYFSMLFKQETGYSYSEYLNTIRINKAKELLTGTSNKVFEIAEYVGYREYKYFVQVFKNYAGITPTQFRRIHSIEK
ncbi:two-component system, response regulator YesN [Gracilibacillus orientalis]|uniref:Two-component system, response regulator YesN n=1 Tax=Gracilibacillus orientalis TaxID=334253 RepID=A0A1I4HU71_9BACI|nr:response regulator [Gracilibacillus orientalis]SFL45759.1 two-component system, response regulator YesN [Gracilibacillus orientalis]